MPWALDTKKGRPFSWTRVQYVALLHSIFPRLPCNASKNRSSENNLEKVVQRS